MDSTLKLAIIQYHNSGKTYQEIKQLLNCSLGTISYHCSDASRKKQHKRARDSKVKFIREAKINAGGKCNICGYDKCLKALDFHHTDPTTKAISVTGKKKTMYEVLRDLGRNAAVLELQKCELICANCHRELHDIDGRV